MAVLGQPGIFRADRVGCSGRVKGELCKPDGGRTSTFACGSVYLTYVSLSGPGMGRGAIEQHEERGNRYLSL